MNTGREEEYKAAIVQLLGNLGKDDLQLLQYVYTILINNYDRKLGA